MNVHFVKFLDLTFGDNNFTKYVFIFRRSANGLGSRYSPAFARLNLHFGLDDGQNTHLYYKNLIETKDVFKNCMGR